MAMAVPTCTTASRQKPVSSAVPAFRSGEVRKKKTIIINLKKILYISLKNHGLVWIFWIKWLSSITMFNSIFLRVLRNLDCYYMKLERLQVFITCGRSYITNNVTPKDYRNGDSNKIRVVVPKITTKAARQGWRWHDAVRDSHRSDTAGTRLQLQ